jgi:hypothetical protein
LGVTDPHNPKNKINQNKIKNKMSEETQETESTWSGLKKTIIGTIATAVTAGGAWFTSTLFGGGDDEEKPKTEQAAAAPVINLSVDNSSKNTAGGGGGTTTVIKEKTVVEKQAAPAESKPAKKSETEDAPW